MRTHRRWTTIGSLLRNRLLTIIGARRTANICRTTHLLKCHFATVVFTASARTVNFAGVAGGSRADPHDPQATRPMLHERERPVLGDVGLFALSSANFAERCMRQSVSVHRRSVASAWVRSTTRDVRPRASLEATQKQTDILQFELVACLTIRFQKFSICCSL